MQDHDWLFDVVIDLCERAEQHGLHQMAAKLEEALDAYLADQAGEPKAEAEAEKPGEASLASFGPISLNQAGYSFGNPRAAAPTQIPKTVPFASRRATPSLALQQLRAARARSEADTEPAEKPMVLLDRVG